MVRVIQERLARTEKARDRCERSEEGAHVGHQHSTRSFIGSLWPILPLRRPCDEGQHLEACIASRSQHLLATSCLHVLERRNVEFGAANRSGIDDETPQRRVSRSEPLPFAKQPLDARNRASHTTRVHLDEGRASGGWSEASPGRGLLDEVAEVRQREAQRERHDRPAAAQQPRPRARRPTTANQREVLSIELERPRIPEFENGLGEGSAFVAVTGRTKLREKRFRRHAPADTGAATQFPITTVSPRRADTQPRVATAHRAARAR